MNIIIKTKNIELTPSLRDFIETKITSLEKYCRACQVNDDPSLTAFAEAIIEVGKTTQHHKKGDIFQAQGQLIFAGHKIHAKTETDDIEKSVDAMRDDLQDQLTRFKGKLIDKSRK